MQLSRHAQISMGRLYASRGHNDDLAFRGSLDTQARIRHAKRKVCLVGEAVSIRRHKFECLARRYRHYLDHTSILVAYWTTSSRRAPIWRRQRSIHSLV